MSTTTQTQTEAELILCDFCGEYYEHERENREGDDE
jgi:hypothetical protein